jgi:hypothetical protein
MAKLTRAGLVHDIMNANASLPMDEVLVKIVAADAVSGIPGKICDLKRAKAYYNLAIKNGLASGVGATTVTRTPKAKAAPKAAKPKLIKPKLDMSGIKDRKPITDKTAEEIADIRNKNLQRLKLVGRKYAKGQSADGASGRIHTDEEAYAEVANLEAELDSFKAPKFLNMADVKALV